MATASVKKLATSFKERYRRMWLKRLWRMAFVML